MLLLPPKPTLKMAFLGSCRRHQNQCLDKANGQHISKKIKKGSRQEFLHQAPRLVWMAICHDLPDSFGWQVHIVSIVSFVFHSDMSDPFSIHALGLKMAGATCQWSLKYGESHAPLTSICRTIIYIIFLGYVGVLKACATHTSKILKGGVPIRSNWSIELLSIGLDWCSSNNGPPWDHHAPARTSSASIRLRIITGIQRDQTSRCPCGKQPAPWRSSTRSTSPPWRRTMVGPPT